MRYSILSIVVVFLTACSANHTVPNRGPSEFERELSDSIKDLRDYSERYTDIKVSQSDYNDKLDSVIDYHSLPEELVKKYDIRFYGDVDKFLTALSKRVGFNFSSVGIKGSKPHDVYLNESHEKLIDILHNVGSQLSHSILLKVSIDRTNGTYGVVLNYGDGE